MNIYKEDVIEALEEEPLSAGHWVSVDGCSACAVGAIFRRNRPRLTRSEISNKILNKVDGDYTPQMSYFLTLPKNWMTAISFVWEHLNYNYDDEDPDIEEARAHMLEWVEENVPEDEILWKV